MLVNERRALLVSGGLLAGAVAVGVLVALPATRDVMWSLDEAALTLAGRIRNRPATVVAEALSLVGGVWVNWAVRIALALLLLFRRRYLELAAFALAVATSEVLIGVVKGWYDRPRPPGTLVETTASSFPSGHAIAAAVTVLGLVVALLPPGPSRRHWELFAATFCVVMALSRVYLNAHWLSDAIAGGLLGAGLALGWPAVLTTLARRRRRVSASRQSDVF